MVGNTFRNRRRVLVVEIALIAAGAIFMAVLGLSDATDYTFGDKLASIHKFDVTLSLEEQVRDGRAVRGLALEGSAHAFAGTQGRSSPAGQPEARRSASAFSAARTPSMPRCKVLRL